MNTDIIEKNNHNSQEMKIHESKQYSTFMIHSRLYGIEVQKVQEVVKPMPLTPVPHAPNFVLGLINLRGQIATAIGLLELFEIGESSHSEMMNIVCNVNGTLVSLLVDEIGDVLEMANSDFEPTPATVPHSVGRLLSGVYKAKGMLLSVIDIEKVSLTIGIKKSKKVSA